MRTFEQCQSLDLPELKSEINERIQILEAGTDKYDELFKETRTLVNLYGSKVFNHIQQTSTKVPLVQSTHICGPDCRIHKS